MRYIISALLFVGLLIGVLFLIIHGLTSNKSNKPYNFANFYNTPMEVRYVQEGIVNNDSLHRSIAITVSKNNINTAIYEGYQGKILNTSNIPNNPNAYHIFLISLYNQGFNISQSSSLTTPKGLCPLGHRYQYQIINGPSTVNQSLWSTSCSQKNIGGKLNNIQTLFRIQNPDYNVITYNVNLNQQSN